MRYLASAAMCMAALSISSVARAEAELDQSNFVSLVDYGATVTDLRGTPFQGFTAGLSGALTSIGIQGTDLDRVDVGLYSVDELTQLPAVRLGNATFQRNQLVGTFAEVWFFSTDLFVTAGQRYAISMTGLDSQASIDGLWRLKDRSYAGGSYGKYGRVVNGYSLAFATYVDTAVTPPSAIPEPATWGMMLLGFGMVGAGVRTRRRSTSVTYA